MQIHLRQSTKMQKTVTAARGAPSKGHNPMHAQILADKKGTSPVLHYRTDEIEVLVVSSYLSLISKRNLSNCRTLLPELACHQALTLPGQTMEDFMLDSTIL